MVEEENPAEAAAAKHTDSNNADNHPGNNADNHPDNNADNHPDNNADNHPDNNADNHPDNNADNHPDNNAEEAQAEAQSGEDTKLMNEEDRSSGEEGGPPAKKQRSTMVRNRNSRAQKRYRERQTQQKASMEAELQQLRDSAASMMRAEQMILERKAHVDKMETLVTSHEKTIQYLQSEMAQLASHWQHPGAEVGEISKRTEQLEHLQKIWLTHMTKLAGFVNQAEADVDYDQRMRMVQEGDTVCNVLDGLRDIGVAWLSSLIVADAMLPDCYCTGQVAFWKKLARDLQLNEDQVVELNSMRQESLNSIDSLYIVRRMLAQQVQGISMGWRELVKDLASTEVKDKVKFIQRLGSLGQEGVSIIDALKDNLASEQQTLVVFNSKCIQQVLLPHQAMCFLQAVHPKHAQRIQSTLSAKRAMSETTPLGLDPSAALARGGSASLLGDPAALNLPQAAPPAAAPSGLQGLLCAVRPDASSSMGTNSSHSNNSHASSVSTLQALQAQFGSGNVAPPQQSNNALPWLQNTLSGLSGDTFSGLSLGGSVSRSASDESVQRQLSSGLAALLHQGQSSSPQMQQQGAPGWQQQLDQFALQLKHQHEQQPALNTQQTSQLSSPAASELHAQLAALDPAALKSSLSMLLPQGSGTNSQISGGWR